VSDMAHSVKPRLEGDRGARGELVLGETNSTPLGDNWAARTSQHEGSKSRPRALASERRGVARSHARSLGHDRDDLPLADDVLLGVGTFPEDALEPEATQDGVNDSGMEVDYEVDEDVADWAEEKEEVGGAVTVTRAADDADVGDADFDPLDAPSMLVSPGRSVELLAGAAPKAGPRRRVLAKEASLPRHRRSDGTMGVRDAKAGDLAPETQEERRHNGREGRGSRPNGAERSALLTTGDAADTHLAKAGASPSRHETSVGNEEDLRKDADLDESEEANVAEKTIACQDDVQDSRRQGGGLDDEAERKSEASTEWHAEQDSQDPQFVTRVRELILGVYERKNPTKLSKVPALLEKYAGAEFKMYQRICKKYGEPVAVDASSWRPGGETVKRRRTASSSDVGRSGAGNRGEDPWSGPHSVEQMRRSALRAQRVLARVAMKRAAVLAAAAPTAPLSPSLAPATSAKQPPPPPPPRGFAKKAAAPRPPDSLRPGSDQPKDATTHRTDSSAAEDEDEEFEGGWPFKESFSPNSASTCSDVADDDEDDQAARRSPSQASSKASRASQASKHASKASHGSKSAPPSALPVPAEAPAAVPSVQQEPSPGRGEDTDDSSVGGPPASHGPPQSACGGDLDAFRQKYNTIFGTLPAASLGAEDSKRSASSSPRVSPRSPPGAWRRRDERDLMPGANRIRPQLGRPPIPPAPPPPGPEAWRSQGSSGHAVWREDSWRRDLPDSAAGRSGGHGLLSRPPAGAPMYAVMPWEMEAQRGGLRPAGPAHGSSHWSRSNWR